MRHVSRRRSLGLAQDSRRVGTTGKPDNAGGRQIRSGCSGAMFGLLRPKAKQVRDFSGGSGKVLGRGIDTYLV